jgi:Sigma-54 interaction domain
MGIDTPNDWRGRCDRLIPPYYRWATLGHAGLLGMIPVEALNRATEAAHSGKSILITGPTGSGKTVLATALFRARECTNPAFACTYTLANPLDQRDHAEEFFAKNADVAVIDGLDNVKTIPQRVGNVLRYRLANGLQTFATAMRGRNYIVETVGADVADGFEFIELPYRDWESGAQSLALALREDADP